MLNLVIFGPPGSGKGTQATYLKEKYELYHLSTGEILRQEIAAKTELGQKAAAFVNSGQLVPDELVGEIIKKVLLEKINHESGFIFDGYPRNGKQALTLENILSSLGLKIDLALDLTASDEELIKRIVLRGQTSGRTDDNEAVVKERLEIYHENADDLVSFYENRHLLHEVDGEGEPAVVFSRINQLIEQEK